MYENGSQMEFTREAPPSAMLQGPGKRILWYTESAVATCLSSIPVHSVAVVTEIFLFLLLLTIQGGVEFSPKLRWLTAFEATRIKTELL